MESLNHVEPLNKVIFNFECYKLQTVEQRIKNSTPLNILTEVILEKISSKKTFLVNNIAVNPLQPKNKTTVKINY